MSNENQDATTTNEPLQLSLLEQEIKSLRNKLSGLLQEKINKYLATKSKNKSQLEQYLKIVKNVLNKRLQEIQTQYTSDLEPPQVIPLRSEIEMINLLTQGIDEAQSEILFEYDRVLIPLEQQYQEINKFIEQLNLEQDTSTLESFKSEFDVFLKNCLNQNKQFYKDIEDKQKDLKEIDLKNYQDTETKIQVLLSQAEQNQTKYSNIFDEVQLNHIDQNNNKIVVINDNITKDELILDYMEENTYISRQDFLKESHNAYVNRIFLEAFMSCCKNLMKPIYYHKWFLDHKQDLTYQT
ncbi:MAG: chromosome segregation ATPase [Candidatus Phytoplasma asteris]|uniref:Chromosome segregation ATPase homolog n=1 Tax=Onion yellows phytoplasma (strain OY-M) TaxID=262768 RepID=Q6YRH8_ONYPE|nr:MAG: chromosome segregation ATPase [Periwinkle leaf yellowing phytoplasma]WEX19348.1 MAG: chromosome segregation ATPase [Candidatus Phytoplasma asteris]BAD04122.1 chromosome segregation ATPase homolog [Onion yellows phytoplasma OY-M]